MMARAGALTFGSPVTWSFLTGSLKTGFLKTGFLKTGTLIIVLPVWVRGCVVHSVNSASSRRTFPPGAHNRSKHAIPSGFLRGSVGRGAAVRIDRKDAPLRRADGCKQPPPFPTRGDDRCSQRSFERPRHRDPLWVHLAASREDHE